MMILWHLIKDHNIAKIITDFCFPKKIFPFFQISGLLKQ